MGFQSLQWERLSQNNPHFTLFQSKAHRYSQLLALSVLPWVTPLLHPCCLPILACRCLFFWNASVLSLFLLAVGDPSEGRGGPVSPGSFIPGPHVVVTTALCAARAPWCCAGALCLGVPRFPSAPITSLVPAPMMCLLSNPGGRKDILSSRPRSVTSLSRAFFPAV